MKEEEIKELFEQFEAIANEYEGVECWSARELAQVLGYSQWRNLKELSKKQKHLVPMQDKRCHIILLTSAK